MWTVFAVIACTITALATERWSIEGISLASLVALVLLFSVVPQPETLQIAPADLLMGFANPALITVLALLVVGRALFNTDALERPAQILSNFGGSNVSRTIFILLSAAAIISAFLNNTPVVVMFIPIIVAIAAQRNFAASRALMPLSFMGILGGMTTLIGSSTNLLVVGVAHRYDVEIGFYDFTIPGLFVLAAGGLYVFYVMPYLIAKKGGATDDAQRPGGRQFLAQIEIDEDHPMLGERAVAGIFPSLEGVTVRSIQRNGKPMLPPFDDEGLSVGDVLVIAATRTALTKALAAGAATLPRMKEEDKTPERESDELDAPVGSFTLAEAVVAPGSRFSGRTIEASRIRSMFGTMVLGLQRRSRMPRTLMREIRLEPGDTLLLGGMPDDYDRLRASRDLLLMERSTAEVPMRAYAPRAIAIFAAIIVAASTGLVPIVVAALTGAYAMIASGCLTLRQAGQSFDRQIYMLVGASLAAAMAMERTGGAQAIADLTVEAMHGQSSAIILSVIFIVTAFLTNILSNNATAVLFTPVAIDIARTIGAPPEAFAVAILFAANCSFATPVGYQTNLLVMGPGRYGFSDFVKAGIPLVLIVWIVFSLVAPWYYAL